ncbi:MAG: RagB/SusD family nutrient uptake outer membrane protein [Dysgonomonas sp.]
MKQLYIIVLSLFLVLPSCDYLNVDNYFSDEMKMDSVFASKRNVEAYLWAIAHYMADEGQIYQGSQESPGPFATDEGFTMFSTGSGYHGLRLALGEISANSMYSFETAYAEAYRVIHKCNTLLSRIDEAKDMTVTERAKTIANARFIRAYSYYKLLIHFGPPIIVGDEVLPSNETLEYYDRPRATYDEAVEYICGEFEAAAVNLPVSLSLMEFGRPTKGAAYGLVARLRLYHASPLYNGGPAALASFGTWKRKTDGVYYVSLQYDEKRWAIAAAAAKRVIDLTDAGVPAYKLHTVDANLETPALPANVTSDPDYYKPWPEGAAGIDHFRSYSEMFTGESVLPTNPEYVWARRSGITGELTRMSFPTKNGGWNGASVTQKVVDAYRMFDGHTIDDSSIEYPYSETGFTGEQKTFSGYRLNSGVYKMYANREMRFYASVGFSECYWPMSSATSSGHYNQTIKYYFEDPNGKSNNPVDHPPTGYVIKKYIHPDDAWEGTNARRMDKAFAMIRYADILLMYAEALNNLTASYTVEIGEETVTVERNKEEIRKAFNLVRHRAGLPGLSQTELADPDKIQELIEKERMVELLWENHRYYDVRRWGIYEREESIPITGMNTDGNKDSFYTRVSPNTSRIGGRVVNKKMVLLPIPLIEVRRLPSLDQNPGWEN